jgi:hypothetical protein
MSTKDIIIDESYKGLIKKNSWFAFNGDLIIDGNAIIKINLVVKGSQIIKGNQVIEGSQIVEGDQVIEGYQVIQGDQVVEGNQIIGYSQIIKGNQTIEGDQKIESYQIINGEQKVKGTMEILGLKTKFSLSFVQDSYRLYFMSNLIKIGCQEHSPEEWTNFTDTQIKKMDEGALEWWRKWKKFVLSTHSNLVEVYNS